MGTVRNDAPKHDWFSLRTLLAVLAIFIPGAYLLQLAERISKKTTARTTADLDAAARRLRIWFWCIGVSVALAIALCGGILYMAASSAFRAEERTQTTLFMIRLVDQFVHEHGRWPKSWGELEQMTFPSDAPSALNSRFTMPLEEGGRGYEWPAQSAHLQENVAIDFGADVDVIINQNPMEFEAIKPIGSFYEYRDYGFVESLQDTLAKSRGAAGQ